MNEADDTTAGGINSDVDQFLSDPNNFKEVHRHYPDSEAWVKEPISVIQTHCAKLYLSKHYVLKIKRPVSYSYIDLSSLNDRRRICLRELEINQRTLPEIYLSVAAVVASESGKLRLSLKPQYLDSGDRVREWCLVMRRFDERTVLDNVAQRGDFNSALAHQTGKSIAEYHNRLSQLPLDDGDSRISEIIDELDFELHKLETLFPASMVSELIRKLYDHYNAARHLLKQRSKAGYVRRCHGDLHLRNMIMIGQKPVPFDALEFNERLSTTDVLYDLAFLIMDLCHRNLHDEANVIFNEYMLRTDKQNVAAASLIGLFISIRASIKAMTTAQTSLTDSAPLDPHHTLSVDQTEALSYLDLAHEALKPKRPIVVAVGGFSGSGKSTISRQLPTRICPIPGALLLQSDAERKDEFNVDDNEKLPPEHYTSLTSQRVYDRLFDKAKLAIFHQYPVIVDATFLSLGKRHQIEELATTAGVEFYGFWLMAPVDVMKSRICNRTQGQSDADVSVLDKQLKLQKGRISWEHIDTDGSVGSITELIWNKLSQKKSVISNAEPDAAADLEA